MTALKKGDIAMLHSLIRHPEFNGMVVIIGAGPHQGYYYIDFPGFEEWDYAHHRNLRKVEPPTDEAARLAMLDCIERAKRGIEVPV